MAKQTKTTKTPRKEKVFLAQTRASFGNASGVPNTSAAAPWSKGKPNQRTSRTGRLTGGGF